MEHGAWKKRKTIAVEEESQNSIDLQSEETRKPGGRPPRHKLSTYNNDVGACERDIALCVDAALSFWNEKSLSKQGPEYELVDALGCVRAKVPAIVPSSFHCNFTARPKNGSEAETKLFFADLMYKKAKDSKEPILTCCSCRILGPVGTKTGLYGCKICRIPDIVQHPKGRFRTEVRYRKWWR